MSIQSDISFLQWCARFARRHPMVVDRAIGTAIFVGSAIFWGMCMYIAWGAE